MPNSLIHLQKPLRYWWLNKTYNLRTIIIIVQITLVQANSRKINSKINFNLLSNKKIPYMVKMNMRDWLC